MSDEIPRDWHRDFFTGLWLDVQRDSFDAEETRELVDAVQEAVQLLPPARILDVPCGEGRIAIELASRGFTVIGIDRSEALLAMARRAADERGVEVDFRTGDMWELPSLDGFDAAVCLWSSLGYATDEDDARMLARLCESLAEGGSLLLETHVVESLLPQWEATQWRWAGEVAVGESRRFDHESGRVLTDWMLAGPDQRQTRSSSIRIYTYRELVALVRGAGFDEIEAFGSPDLEPFELGASRLLLLARKAPVEGG